MSQAPRHHLFPIYMLFHKEVMRFFVMPWQTIGPPVVTTILYFVIFGVTIGPRIGDIGGVSYLEFIMPGLIMMNALIYTYSNAAYSLQITKITNSFYDILTSPMSHLQVMAGYILSSAVRGALTSVLIYLTALFFLPFSVAHPIYLLLFFLFVLLGFGALGLVLGLVANTFEQVSLFPTFLITPLTFLGGIFYSVSMLPQQWQTVSRLNPFLYIINGMRYGFYSISDVHPDISFLIAVGLFFILSAMAYLILKTGWRIRN